MLEADPIFKDAEITELAKETDDEDLKSRASALFGQLSSGHKIVLLTITRLVETVEERTLVLLTSLKRTYIRHSCQRSCSCTLRPTDRPKWCCSNHRDTLARCAAGGAEKLHGRSDGQVARLG